MIGDNNFVKESHLAERQHAIELEGDGNLIKKNKVGDKSREAGCGIDEGGAPALAGWSGKLTASLPLRQGTGP